MSTGISSAGINALIVKSLCREDEYRIAWHLEGEKRWRFTIKMSERVAKEFMIQVQSDIRRSDYKLTKFRHSLKLFTRDVLPNICKKHRKELEITIEKKKMLKVPGFGMF